MPLVAGSPQSTVNFPSGTFSGWQAPCQGNIAGSFGIAANVYVSQSSVRARWRARDTTIGFRRDWTSQSDKKIPWTVKAAAAPPPPPSGTRRIVGPWMRRQQLLKVRPGVAA